MALRFFDSKHLMKILMLLLISAPVIAQEAGDRPDPKTPATANVEKSEQSVDSPQPAVSSEAGRGEVKSMPVEKREERPQPADAAIPQSGTSDKWQFQFTPYLFMASVKGEVGARGLTADVDAGFTDIVDELNFGFMSAFEARKNRFVLLTDLLYLNLSDSRDTGGPLFSSVKEDFKAFILDPEVGYRVVDSEKGSLDLLGGFRYWYLRNELDFRAGILPARNAVQSKNWVDAVGGLRGRARLSDRWFLTGKTDFGGGGSDFTYQLFGAAGVTVGKRGSLVFGYRYLKVDYDSDDGFRFDASLKGPIIGFGLRF